MAITWRGSYFSVTCNLTYIILHWNPYTFIYEALSKTFYSSDFDSFILYHTP